MRHDPILANKVIPVGAEGNKTALSFYVEGGLHYLKGNSAPYFTLTYTKHRKGFPEQCYSGCAGHDEILKHFPKFADLAKMHLSDIDGAPMHAEANGWYALAGALPGFADEQYHAGNSPRHFPKPEGAERRGEWDSTDYRNPTPKECLQIFADLVRIPIDEAEELHELVCSAAVKAEVNQFDWKQGRAFFAAWIERQAPRWKAEAEACIAKYGLVIYGDKYEPAEA
jgi:hypothetical protein